MAPRPVLRLRAVVVGLLALVSVTTPVSLILLARFLLDGSQATGHALVLAGSLADQRSRFRDLVLGNSTPAAPASGSPLTLGPRRRIFLFPQMTRPRLAIGWRPSFTDYLYTSYTNATAFSPADTLPLSAMAKLLMTIQSLTALVTILLVAARAVNALG
jgi:hypothetical protein